MFLDSWHKPPNEIDLLIAKNIFFSNKSGLTTGCLIPSRFFAYYKLYTLQPDYHFCEFIGIGAFETVFFRPLRALLIMRVRRPYEILCCLINTSAKGLGGKRGVLLHEGVKFFRISH